MAERPLADRMRPRTLDEVVGQSELAAAGSPLRRALERGEPHSMVLWGPPGTGKTTIALALAREIDAHFEQISAVTSGIKDLREVIARATERRERSERTLLFVDEIHRWNKIDALPVLKDGDSCRAASCGTSVGSCFTASSRDESRSYTGSTGV